MNQQLEQLWQLTGYSRQDFDQEENDYFDSIGLNLIKEPECWEYW